MTERLHLDEKLDTTAVPKLIDILRARQGADLILDARDLQLIGGLALQTIIVAANDWQDGGHRLQIENVSEEVEEQLRLLGTNSDVLTEGDIR